MPASFFSFFLFFFPMLVKPHTKPHTPEDEKNRKTTKSRAITSSKESVRDGEEQLFFLQYNIYCKHDVWGAQGKRWLQAEFVFFFFFMKIGVREIRD